MSAATREEVPTTMFLLFKLWFWLARRLWFVIAAFGAGLAAGTLMLLREEQRTWGVRADDSARQLPGDDLVAVADVVDTRSLRIDAAPDQVWPWLVQMGYGRAGWYSYDKLDMDQPSADTILEEHQDLAVGDLLPTHPGGGFVVRVLEPGRALVAYLDAELVQREAPPPAQPSGDDEGEGASVEDTPAGLQAAGALGELSMPDFRGTWTFVLEPEAGGGTRLIERFRLWTGDGGPPQRLAMPFMGLGVFLMTRRHMLGVKERAERLAAGDAPATDTTAA
jgi:hypothetical protein